MLRLCILGHHGAIEIGFIIIIIFTLGIPERGLKIDENDWKGMMLNCSVRAVRDI